LSSFKVPGSLVNIRFPVETEHPLKSVTVAEYVPASMFIIFCETAPVFQV